MGVRTTRHLVTPVTPLVELWWSVLLDIPRPETPIDPAVKKQRKLVDFFSKNNKVFKIS